MAAYRRHYPDVLLSTRTLVLVVAEHYAAAPRCRPAPRAKTLVVVIVIIHLCSHNAFDSRA